MLINLDQEIHMQGAVSFIPIGQHTVVTINGQWQSPSFIGSFSPESSVDNKEFNASWNILSFNREIPAIWSDDNINNFGDNSFGVTLIETVDHYQQNMRSAKYARTIIFICILSQ
jgi:inner membrane protein